MPAPFIFFEPQDQRLGDVAQAAVQIFHQGHELVGSSLQRGRWFGAHVGGIFAKEGFKLLTYGISSMGRGGCNVVDAGIKCNDVIGHALL